MRDYDYNNMSLEEILEEMHHLSGVASAGSDSNAETALGKMNQLNQAVKGKLGSSDGPSREDKQNFFNRWKAGR